MSAINTARLRAARERLGLAQIDLARRLQLSDGACGQWERGDKVPAADNLKRLSQILNVSADWLLDLDDKAPGAIADPAAGGSGGYDSGPKSSRHNSPEAVLADYNAAPGLRDLAGDRELIAALRIAPDEWAALHSLEYADGLTKEGYQALLLLLRSASLESKRAKLSSHGGRPSGAKPL